MPEQLVKLEVWALTGKSRGSIDKVLEKLHGTGVYVDCFTCWNTESQKLRGKKQVKALKVLKGQ